MKESKKFLKEKGIRAEDVKNLPPIEELCKPIPHSSTIDVHSLHFDEGDIPYGKPPDQCLDELDTCNIPKIMFSKIAYHPCMHNHLGINFKVISKKTEALSAYYFM